MPRMIGQRSSLLRRQRDVSQPLPGASWDGYFDAMRQTARECKRDGITAFAFGDLWHSGMQTTKVERFSPFGVFVVLSRWGMS